MLGHNKLHTCIATRRTGTVHVDANIGSNFKGGQDRAVAGEFRPAADVRRDSFSAGPHMEFLAVYECVTLGDKPVVECAHCQDFGVAVVED